MYFLVDDLVPYMHITKLRTVYPGDDIHEKGTTSLGIQNNKALVYGTLCRVQQHYFILSKTSRYYPYVDDVVVGRVIYVSSEYYKVDLDTYIGILPALSFTNASKRNKPDIKKDDWIFCKIVQSGIEPMLSCIGDGYGKIDGHVFKLEIWKVQMLYVCNILYKIGRKYNFRVLVGINGYLSLEGDTPREVVHVFNEIEQELCKL